MCTLRDRRDEYQAWLGHLPQPLPSRRPPAVRKRHHTLPTWRHRFVLATHARLWHRPSRCDTDSVLILIVALHRTATLEVHRRGRREGYSVEGKWPRSRVVERTARHASAVDSMCD